MYKDVEKSLKIIEEKSREYWGEEGGFSGTIREFKKGDITELREYYRVNYPVNGVNFVELNDGELLTEILDLANFVPRDSAIKLVSQLLVSITKSIHYTHAFKARCYKDGYNDQLHIAFVSDREINELFLYWSPD